MNLKKFRHGSASVALSALVIAAVILINVGVGVLFSSRLWRLDETSEKIYTLDDSFKDYLQMTFDEVNASREEPVQVDIIFCNDPDMLKGTTSMRYVYYTALALQKAFPDTIHVSAVNIWSNPSAVDAYRTNSYSNIYQSNVIIASGSEFRVTSIDSYYVTDTDSGDVWAYHGEKKMVQSIMAVTKAESPICGITVNHGEPFASDEGKARYARLLEVVEDAGYEIVYLDLARDEIPENCRLLLTFDPQTDFRSEYGSADSISEINKLDVFLENAYSYLVFVDADTPELPNLEMFLEEWGISFGRVTDAENAEDVIGNYRVSATSAVNSDGTAVIGEYEPEGLGGGVTENMRKYGGSPKVVFGNVMPIYYSKGYEQAFVLADEEKGTGAYSYGSYYRNNHSRAIYDVFRADEDAVAYAVKDGEILKNDAGEAISDTYGSYKLMTLTRENRTVGEGQGYTQVNYASYVGAIGSTDFASDSLLASNAYANTDLLLATLRMMGREVVPVGLLFEPMYDATITEYSSTTQQEYLTATAKTTWTVVLIALPLVVTTTIGCTVLVRRKHGR